MPTPIILLTGYATAGKDLFCSLLIKTCPERYKRVAFADPLKRRIAPFISTEFGVDIFSCTPAEKTLIRPLMVAYGCQKREQDPLCWVKLADEAVAPLHCVGRVPVISDCRFLNEFTYFKEKYGQDVILVNVCREGVIAPNDEEKRNQPVLDALANYTVNWTTVPESKISELTSHVYSFLLTLQH